MSDMTVMIVCIAIAAYAGIGITFALQEVVMVGM